VFKKLQRNLAASRLLEEQLFEQVAQELSKGEMRVGLWTQALANSNGDEEKAKAIYIQYRVQSIKDEKEILEVVVKDKLENTRIPTKDSWYILCPKCKFEQWVGCSKCKKCGISFSA